MCILNMEIQMSYHLCQKSVCKGYDHATMWKKSHQGKWDRVEFSIVTVGPNTDTRLGEDNPGAGMCQCGPEAATAPLPRLCLPHGSIYKTF